MIQAYATGSAKPLQDGTINFLVTTPVEPSISMFYQGLASGVIVSVFILFTLEFLFIYVEKWTKHINKE